MSNNGHLNTAPQYPGATTITEIHDSGPKWRAIIALTLGAVFLSALTLAALTLIGSLGIRERAALAIADNAAVTAIVQPYKVIFWALVWIGGASVAFAATVSLSTILFARAWIAVTDARSAHLALRSPPLITQPARSVELRAGQGSLPVRKDRHEYSKETIQNQPQGVKSWDR